MKVAAQLAKRMIELDPENEAAYSDNARTFIGDLGAAKKELEAQAAPLRGIAVAVQHDHSRYLIAWLGIRSVVTIEPEHFVQPGPARLAEIIERGAAPGHQDHRLRGVRRPGSVALRRRKVGRPGGHAALYGRRDAGGGGFHQLLP